MFDLLIELLDAYNVVIKVVRIPMDTLPRNCNADMTMSIRCRIVGSERILLNQSLPPWPPDYPHR